MAYYRFADLTVSSAFPLQELIVVPEERRMDTAFTVHLAPHSPVEPAAGQWVHHWPSATGVVSLSLAVTDKGYLLRFPGCADFVISADGCAIEAWPAKATSDGRLRQLLLNQVLPRLLAHTGHLTLHASAVQVDGYAIAFAAPTCGGKSTLAASLHLAGYPALSDDGLMVVMNNSQPWGLPLYAGLRLRPNSRAGLFSTKVESRSAKGDGGKDAVLLRTNGAPVSMPLRCLYVLEAPDCKVAKTVSITRLSAQDACIQLIHHGFQLDPADRLRGAALFGEASTLAVRLPTFLLKYPREFASLPAVHEAIVRASDPA